jgi:hypothetical protein
MRRKGWLDQTEYKKQQELLANYSCHQYHWQRLYPGLHFILLVRLGFCDP